MVDALHLPLASIWNCLTLIDIFAVLRLPIPFISFCTFRVAVRFLGLL